MTKPPTVQPTNRPAVYAGIDAGGSHTEAVVVDAERQILSRARGGPGALRPDNATAVAGVIARTLKSALKASGKPPLAALVVAAAGAGRAAERTALQRALARHKLAKTIKIIGDGEAALESAFPGSPGIVVISGTGSIGYARDAAGSVQRVGGLGWQLGDEGSGYALGRASLGAAGKAADGRGPATGLLERIHNATRTKDLAGLIRWSQSADRSEVAALAQVACDGADEGDTVARELVENSAHELASHVIALLRKLAPENPGGIALAGGLLGKLSPVRIRLAGTLSRIAPQLTLVERDLDPALGAATLATRL